MRFALVLLCVTACGRTDNGGTAAPGSAAAARGSAAAAGSGASTSCLEQAKGKCSETQFGFTKASCEAVGGTLVAGPCPSEARIGTCRQVVGDIETAAVHYYTGFALPAGMDLKTFCEARGANRHFAPVP